MSYQDRSLTPRTRNPGERIQCPLCEYVSDSTSAMVAHMRDEHGIHTDGSPDALARIRDRMVRAKLDGSGRVIE